MKSSLPRIIDTKLMAMTPPLKEDIIGSTLEELVKIMDQDPFKLPNLANSDDHPGKGVEKIVTGCLILLHPSYFFAENQSNHKD